MFRLGTTESTLFILWLSLLCFCENVTSKALQNITASSVDVPESSPHNHYYHERPKVELYSESDAPAEFKPLDLKLDYELRHGRERNAHHHEHRQRGGHVHDGLVSGLRSANPSTHISASISGGTLQRPTDGGDNPDEDEDNEEEDENSEEISRLMGGSADAIGEVDYDTRLEANVSRILDALIASHDRRIRPNYGGPPTEVNVTLHVITISAVSEVSMDYTVDLYLRQFWRDPRLAFQTLTDDEHISLTVGIDMVKSIWVSDTFFPNEKRSFFHETTTHNSFLRIDSHGNVIRSIRLTVTANCPMNLHSFPLDVQVCALEIESYGYGTNDIIYHWHGENAVTIDENVHLAHFTIGDQSHVERTISLSTGNYSRLTAYFTLKRNIGFYLIQIYFPSSLIVVISWVSFFLNREATQARVAIGVTTVLTQTTLMTNANASLPKVSYVKSLDVFLGVCFFIVFASLLEYATVGFLMKRQRTPYRGGGGADRMSTMGSTMCFYELEEQPPPLTAVVRSATDSPPHHAAPQQITTTLVPKRRVSMRRNTSSNGLDHSAARPLLNAVSLPTHTATTTLTAGSTATTNTTMNNGGAPPHRLSVFVPSDGIAMQPFIMAGAVTTADDSDVIGSGRCCVRIRPSQVDLFSRIAFPVFFLLFHLAYWTFYLEVLW